MSWMVNGAAILNANLSGHRQPSLHHRQSTTFCIYARTDPFPLRQPAAALRSEKTVSACAGKSDLLKSAYAAFKSDA